MIILSTLRYEDTIYIDGSKKDEKVEYAVVLSDSTIRRRQIPQNSIYSAEQLAIINAIYSTANYNQKRVIITQHNNSSLRERAQTTPHNEH
jgi:hypothetical protein